MTYIEDVRRQGLTLKGFKIRTCTEADSALLTEIIRKSFQDVARQFGLTAENAPKHPSNCTEDWVINDIGRGVSYFIAGDGDSAAGCVAMERANPGVCYLERLAVLPGTRRRGIGRMLVEHVVSEAGLLGAHSIDIGIIAGHTELKEWYARIGFVEGESRIFPHLPFSVTFMSYGLD